MEQPRARLRLLVAGLGAVLSLGLVAAPAAADLLGSDAPPHAAGPDLQVRLPGLALGVDLPLGRSTGASPAAGTLATIEVELGAAPGASPPAAPRPAPAPVLAVPVVVTGSPAAAASVAAPVVATPAALEAGVDPISPKAVVREVSRSSSTFLWLLLGCAVAFLVVAGRIDRRSPTLTAAPVDAREDVMEFGG